MPRSLQIPTDLLQIITDLLLIYINELYININYKGHSVPSFKTTIGKRRGYNAGSDDNNSGINAIIVTYLCIQRSQSHDLLQLQTILFAPVHTCQAIIHLIVSHPTLKR